MRNHWMSGVRRRNVGAVLAGTLAAIVVVGTTQAQVIYVNNNIASPNNSVSALLVDPSGALTPLSGSPYLTGGGGSSAPNVGAVDITTLGPYLYATNVITNSVAAFTINEDGTLTTIPGSPFHSVGTRPNGIAVNAAGTLLFAADNVSNQVSVFSIASNGALSLVLGAPFSVAAEPVDLDIDSTNSLLFASHHTLGVGVYSIGGGGSSLTPIGGSPFAAGTDERGMAINAAATRLYVADGTNQTVSGFTIGGGGVLSAVPGSPFLTGGLGATATLFHPSLSVLYVSNDGSNDVSAFTIAGNGALTPLGGSPFASGGAGTSSMAIDTANAFLFAVNGGTNPTPSRDVSVFSISGSGTLTPVGGSPFSTGVLTGRPGSIIFSTVNRPDCTAGPPGVCVMGNGKNTTDCVSEWFLDTDPPPSISPRTGFPDHRVDCQNGNAGCDADSLNDRCTIRIRICINNQDPRIPCTPTNVLNFESLKPRLGIGDAFDIHNFNEINKAVSGGTCNNDAFRSCLVDGDCLFGGLCTGAPVIGVPFVRRTTVITAGSTNADLNNCSNVMSIEVPLRNTTSGFKSKSKSFRARIKTSAGVKDTDVLKLTCFPAP